MISVTTKRDVVRGVPKSWDRQYSDSYGEPRVNNRDPYEITQELRKLNLETCSPADVDKIIGNDSWTKLECDHCGEPAPMVAVIVGPYESMGLCADCVSSAAQAIEARRAETGAGTGSVHESAVRKDAP